MAFWASIKGDAVPKLSYRWVATITGGTGIKTYTLVSFQKPNYEVHVSEYININDAFYKPGMLTWNPIEVVMIDGEGGDINNSKILDGITHHSGYHLEPGGYNPRSALTKGLANIALGSVRFEQLSSGARTQGGSQVAIVDSWTLVKPFIGRLDYGRASYQTEQVTTINLTLRYDHAIYTAAK